MILALRRRHRRVFLILGVLLPMAFIGGIAARRPVPAVAALPRELQGVMQKFAATNWTRADLFAKAPVRIRLLREHIDGGEFGLTFLAAKDFVKPDLIVYWSAGDAAIRDGLPEDAVLLGTFSSAVLPVPDEAAHAIGKVILYSLADGEIVDVSKPIQFSDLTQ
jgi:hypothetical protein